MFETWKVEIILKRLHLNLKTYDFDTDSETKGFNRKTNHYDLHSGESISLALVLPIFPNVLSNLFILNMLLPARHRSKG